MISKRKFLGLAFLALFAFLIFWLVKSLKVDSCLDNGGKWDYEEKRCLFSESEQ